MKTLALFLTLIFAIFSLTTTCSAQTTPRIVYPVYPDGTVSLIEYARTLQSNAVINGEGTECWDNEYIVIATGTPEVARVFRINLEPHGAVPQGFKLPVLTRIGSVNAPLYPLTNLGYWTYADGTKETYGEALVGYTTVFFYAWSWLDGQGQERWSSVVTWGPGSGIDQVGIEIDRSQFATRPGEPRELGCRILDMYMVNNAPLIGVFADEKVEFTLEASTDLRTWRAISSTTEAIPELDTWLDGVWFKSMFVKPIADHWTGFGQKQFFRLRKLR